MGSPTWSGFRVCLSWSSIVFWWRDAVLGCEFQMWGRRCTVYPKKYAHGSVVLCFVVVMQSFIMNSHEVFIHIHQGCFAGTGAIVRLPQCQWSKPDGYGTLIYRRRSLYSFLWENQSMYNHNKAQQSKDRVHISWDIVYTLGFPLILGPSNAFLWNLMNYGVIIFHDIFSSTNLYNSDFTPPCIMFTTLDWLLSLPVFHNGPPVALKWDGESLGLVSTVHLRKIFVLEIDIYFF